MENSAIVSIYTFVHNAVTRIDGLLGNEYKRGHSILYLPCRYTRLTWHSEIKLMYTYK